MGGNDVDCRGALGRRSMLSLGTTAWTPSPLQDPAVSQAFSSSPCYTCRRRRVTCDRLIPTCRKCDKAQKACLGYKKPLTWVHGVASRGKMMGLTFDDITANKSSQATLVNGIAGPEEHNSAESFPFGSCCFGPAHDASEVLPGNPGSFESWPLSSVRGANGPEECQKADMALSEWDSSDQRRKDQIECYSHIPLTLIDPIFQGLDKISRYYLTYFDRKFCKLMVLFEVPHKNPYRRLIQMVNVSSGVCAAMAAIGACHHLHVLHYSDQHPLDNHYLKSKARSLEDGEQFARSPNAKVRVTYQHLLLLKHRALSQLEQNLSNPETRGQDTSIATSLLLMVLDMVESGRGTWKLHVEGAKRLLQSRFSPLGEIDEDGSPRVPCAAYDSFNTFLAGSCMTFDIMGSTLTPSGSWSEPVSSQLITSPNLLSDTEKEVWLGCPGSLLHIILYISSLRHAGSSSQTLGPKVNLSTILSQINAFDPERWTREVYHSMYAGTEYPFPDHHFSKESYWRPPEPAESNSPLSDSDALLHLASAYKITITLYAIRILLHPSPEECTFFAEQVTTVLTHISLIPPSSELFKSILWPTFIAGAECRCPEQRAWFRDKLDHMWRQCWTVNIREAMRVLDAIWSREDQHDGDWAEYFDRFGANWLFI
ncbi:C6 finger domain-containing protein Acr-2 [Blastomyces gilchristii SLH14081]|uniref:C6 finger domain-containing protein Acr-2 n=1 Tax=Blastomyces gilchristii (strain SLH14081) TaxID=559298 RepID=A0A179U9Q7_BLAGS|nr:C6 finger domain-containing protein Acr-2 [Blastomyces gilchristii SLH14081]OAT04058.1 C6 finger domain-containing protein Acr-2 [Blastomyces gilchristii SLH14081]